MWDKKNQSLNLQDFENALGVMSSGEVQRAKFFASIWFHNNKTYGFDLADAVSSLDTDGRELIMEWVARPFWP
ncbi:hypothetical protein [Candidatus Vondammii sp. HM_W22]|uniref:hypothetical protein n=1 Tax=Candidatus Vondammii sp. HM_W22 TaxID=2687299 RepID=UPI001F13BB4A|nr:hypothetical protein [Candidatus Vondammii sp. HM_W22]